MRLVHSFEQKYYFFGLNPEKMKTVRILNGKCFILKNGQKWGKRKNGYKPFSAMMNKKGGSWNDIYSIRIDWSPQPVHPTHFHGQLFVSRVI